MCLNECVLDRDLQVGLQWQLLESGVEECKKAICMLEIQKTQSKGKGLDLPAESHVSLKVKDLC